MRKGSYVLILLLDEDVALEVGALGHVELKAGLYAYVGSAQSGLENRVGRHFSKVKRRHWHIDYLIERSEPVSALLVEGPDMECEINAVIDILPGSSVPFSGFGSSDCGCESHLHRITEASLAVLLNELRWIQAQAEGQRND